MNATKIRLHFKAPLHIAARGVGFERVGWVIHSDTLYSALLTIWSQIAPRDEIVQCLQAEPPPFLLSSAFPYQGEAEFYPAPLTPFRLVMRAQHQKAFKKVQFIEAALFRDILSGKIPCFCPPATRQGGRFWTHAPLVAGEDISSPEKRDEDEVAQRYGASVAPAPEEPIIHEIEVPRVVVDRISNQGALYFVSELHFADDAGLFFWVKFNDPKIKNRFMHVLRVLGDEGLGLDRTSGKGLFEIKDKDKDIKEDETLPGPEKASRFLTLALYHPKPQEMTPGFLQRSGYELVQRSGYVFARSYRRQTLTMFAEGSVFGGAPGAGEGYGNKTVVLDPNFEGSTLSDPIYRYGYAFPIGFPNEA